MAESRSDGLVAVVLLDAWLRRMLTEPTGEPVVAQDLVFRDLFSLVARQPRTAARLVDLHRQITEAGTSAPDVQRELQAAIDTSTRVDAEFAEALAELLRVLRPLLPPEQLPLGDLDTHRTGRHRQDTVSIEEPGLVDRILNSLRRFDSEPVETSGTDSIPVSVFLSDADGDELVEAAVAEMLASAGIEIIGRDDPVTGSWSLRQHRARRDDGHDTASMMRHLGPTIAALQAYEEAVVRAGGLLIVKTGPRLVVQQLTPAQEFRLDRQPELASAPHQVLDALRPRSWEPAGPPG
jgi:hypothetical protein